MNKLPFSRFNILLPLVCVLLMLCKAVPQEPHAKPAEDVLLIRSPQVEILNAVFQLCDRKSELEPNLLQTEYLRTYLLNVGAAIPMFGINPHGPSPANVVQLQKFYDREIAGLLKNKENLNREQLINATEKLIAECKRLDLRRMVVFSNYNASAASQIVVRVKDQNSAIVNLKFTDSISLKLGFEKEGTSWRVSGMDEKTKE